MMLFSADSMTMRFGPRRVLSDVYIEAYAGEIIGIVGRNGSGKSTLYKCLLGLHPSSTGAIQIDGRPVSRSEAPRHFAWLPQDSYLPADLRLEKSVDLILGRGGNRTPLEQDSRTVALMARKARDLSLGEVRYVECLIALFLERPVVLLDEPFSHVEPIFCEILERRMQEAAINKVVMVCDHLYENLRKASTRIMVLEGGTLRNAERLARLPLHV